MKKLFYHAWIRFNTRSFTGTWILGMSVWLLGLYTESFLGKVIWTIFMTAIIMWSLTRNDKWFEEEAKKLPENDKIY